LTEPPPQTSSVTSVL